MNNNSFLQSWQYAIIVAIVLILDVAMMYLKIVPSSDGFTLLGLVAGHYLGFAPIQGIVNSAVNTSATTNTPNAPPVDTKVSIASQTTMKTPAVNLPGPTNTIIPGANG